MDGPRKRLSQVFTLLLYIFLAWVDIKKWFRQSLCIVYFSLFIWVLSHKKHSPVSLISFIHYLGRSPGEGNGHSLQSFCLGHPMDRGAWWTTVHGVARIGHRWSTAARTCLPESLALIVCLECASNLGGCWSPSKMLICQFYKIHFTSIKPARQSYQIHLTIPMNVCDQERFLLIIK